MSFDILIRNNYFGEFNTGTNISIYVVTSFDSTEKSVISAEINKNTHATKVFISGKSESYQFPTNLTEEGQYVVGY